ncbi:MAG: hypothetical protein IJQ94_03830 [Bacteroidales bacterium]|nr:hypothetical protein [Bacteroidales bacterium]
MKGKVDIQFCFAKDETGKIVHIDDVPLKIAERGRYYSVDEGDEMIARKGKVVAWHFAHKDGRTGSHETYLHKLGKYAFKQAFEENDQFYIIRQAPYPCSRMSICPIEDKSPCSPEKPFRFDLKKYYSHCELEKHIKVDGQDFVADVCLIPKNPKNDSLIVEIQVTHASTRRKLYSGLRIIEILINQDCDIIQFQRHCLIEKEGVKFYGFKRPRLPKDVTTDRVRAYSLKKIWILKDGSTHISHEACDIFTSDGEWNTQNTLFYVVMVIEDNYYLNSLDFELFAQLKAIDYGYFLPNQKMLERYRRIVLPTAGEYYIWHPQLLNGPMKINEVQEGFRIEQDKCFDLQILELTQESTMSTKEQKYWDQILDCIYCENNGVDIDSLYRAIYLASIRKMYIQLVPHSRLESEFDDYWIKNEWNKTDVCYIPTLVDEIPENIFSDGK